MWWSLWSVRRASSHTLHYVHDGCSIERKKQEAAERRAYLDGVATIIQRNFRGYA